MMQWTSFSASFRTREYGVNVDRGPYCVGYDLVEWWFCIHFKLRLKKFDIEDWKEDEDCKESAGGKKILDWQFALLPDIKIIICMDFPR